jgi:hypothetical protein
MKKLLLVATGAGIGYVLGARAGRPAYDRIVERARRLGAGIRLDRTQQATRDAMAEAKQAGEQLRDKADSRLADTVDKVGSALPGSGADDDVVRLPDTTMATETRAGDMAGGF